jgi:alpha-beta hydrolase superfamily lysophospholipase
MPVENFIYEPIHLKDDYEGKVEASFIKSKDNRTGRTPVFYLHGFVDYFFHGHVAKKFHDKGYNFYALELRKYGHSLLAHQHPNYCKSINEYFEEIDIALEKTYALDNKKIIFLGHSTGGLIASLYANRGNKKDLLCALLLNSPFLEINMPSLFRKLTIPLFKMALIFNDYLNLPNALSPLYPKSIHKDYEGEWDFDLNYKPIKGFPAYFKWLVAIKEAQDEIKAGLSISIPILLLHSSSSFIPKKWSEEIHTSDVVLNVEDMKKYAKNLGRNIQEEEIVDGRHDLFLSLKPVRENAFNTMFDYLAKTKC